MNADVLDAIQLALSGETDIASGRLSILWAGLAADDFFHRCVVAHYMADLQAELADELRWDQLALHAAQAASPASFEGQIPGATLETFLPSLHLNLASSYERSHNLDRAAEHAKLALAATALLPPSSILQATRNAILRISDRLASAARAPGSSVSQSDSETTAAQQAVEADGRASS